MKRLLVVVSVAALLLLGLAINNIGDNSPTITSDGDTSAVIDGGLPELGPIQLVTDFYTQSFAKSCTRGTGEVSCSGSITGISQAGFDFTTAECATPISFNVLFSPAENNDCEVSNTGAGGKLVFDFDFTSYPCDGLVFASVQLVDGDGNTLIINLTNSNNEPC